MVAVPFDRDSGREGFQTPRDIYSFESIFGPKGPNMRLDPLSPEEIDTYNNTRRMLLQEGVLQPGDVPEINPEDRFVVPPDTETSKKIDEFMGKYLAPAAALLSKMTPLSAPVALGVGVKKAIDWADRQFNPPVDNKATRPGDESWGSGGTGSSGPDSYNPDLDDAAVNNGMGPGGQGPVGEGRGTVGISFPGNEDGYTPPDTDMSDEGDPEASGWGFADGGTVEQSPRDFMAQLNDYRMQIAQNPALKEILLEDALNSIPLKARDRFSPLIENYLNEGMTEGEAGGEWIDNNPPSGYLDKDPQMEVPFEDTSRGRVINPMLPDAEPIDSRSMARGGDVKKPPAKEGTVKKTTVVIDDKGKTQKVQKDVSKGADKVSEVIQRAPPKKASKGAPKKMAAGGAVPMPQVIADPSAAPPEAMADDVPMEAKEGDFIINMDAVKNAGVMDIKKMINTALEEAAMDGKTIVPPNAEGGHQGNPVDIFVHNGEVHIPKELVAYIGEDKLEKLNNRGLKKRAQREEAQKQQKATQMLPQNIAQYAPKGYAEGGEVAAPFPIKTSSTFSGKERTSSISSRNNRGFYLRRRKAHNT